MLRYLPPALLVVVALHQAVLVGTRELTPWLGGGFGMFSTNDAGWTRHTHLFVEEGGLETEVDLPEHLDDLEERLRVLPSDARLEDFARQLSAAMGQQHPGLTAVRVELWRRSFDADELRPIPERIHDFRHEVDLDVGP